MRPKNVKTRIFLDGGDPDETKQVIGLLGFLDGQTTNPTLIARNPDAKERLAKGLTFSEEEILWFYREVVGEVSRMIPDGSISIEVYADASTTSDRMVAQGREMFSWIPNAHVKLPTSKQGLEAAGRAVKEGLRVNMTLCFTQEQAAAVYSATAGAKKGDVFISPFIGRLDDRGENGMDLIENILKMYGDGDGHVEVLTASVRSLDHLLRAFQLGSDIVTAPFKVLTEWGEAGLPVPEDDYAYDPGTLKAILYREISLARDWQTYDISHELTDRGMERFSEDWNALIG